MNTTTYPLLPEDLPMWGGVTPYWRRFFGNYAGLMPAVIILGLGWLFIDILYVGQENILNVQVMMHLLCTIALAVLMSLVSIYVQKRLRCQVRLIRIYYWASRANKSTT